MGSWAEERESETLLFCPSMCAAPHYVRFCASVRSSSCRPSCLGVGREGEEFRLLLPSRCAKVWLEARKRPSGGQKMCVGFVGPVARVCCCALVNGGSVCM